MTELSWTRVDNDTYGNPRYVVHFTDIMPDKFKGTSYEDVISRYDKTVKWANKLGGKKFHNKKYGGGIVFQSYNLDSTEKFILEKLALENAKM